MNPGQSRFHWLIPKRRWFQFSLRTLLLVTAALAIWLGQVTERVRRQRKAVESLTAIQADIFYNANFCHDDARPLAFSLGQFYYHVTERDWQHDDEDEAPRGPKWLQDWIGVDYFRSVIAVDLRGASPGGEIAGEILADVSQLRCLEGLNLDGVESLTDADLAHLKRLTSLHHLFLKETHITDAGLANLAGLTNLRYLSLAGTKITDAGLSHLQGLARLEVLELSDTGISDAGLKHLRSLKRLKFLYLDGTKVTKEGVKQLEAALPKCCVLLCGAGAIG
jgi:hypothetical protein